MKNGKKKLIVIGVVVSCLVLFLCVGMAVKSRNNESRGGEAAEPVQEENYLGYHDFCDKCGLDLTKTYGGITDEAKEHLARCGTSSYISVPVYEPSK